MAITTKKVIEYANRLNFDLSLHGTKIMLRAKFEFSDGSRPSTIPLTTREAYMYLCGFSAAKYSNS